MATAEQMKLVFRLGEVSFSLPVDHLVEIRQGSTGWLDRGRHDTTCFRLGSIAQRDGQLDVYDLGGLLQLPAWSGSDEMTLLVLTGVQGAWAMPVDEIAGIFNNDSFTPLSVSPLLGHVSRLPGLAFELWQDQVLVCGDAGRWEQMLG